MNEGSVLRLGSVALVSRSPHLIILKVPAMEQRLRVRVFSRAGFLQADHAGKHLFYPVVFFFDFLIDFAEIAYCVILEAILAASCQFKVSDGRFEACQSWTEFLVDEGTQSK